MFQILDLLVSLGDLLFGVRNRFAGVGEFLLRVGRAALRLSQLTSQLIVFPLQLLRVLNLLALATRHASHGTPIRSTCTAS